ncbi:MAG: NAD-dependent protein deacylase [Candidatus Abyssobacteria bacterium SURF_5]|uniref:protein acetyllysine N-acetyltransferase n=1 Tax=Abyssobacteria bacterium (strain SURF_5) TaxID=2093360 RepID=A0A3A4NYL1_ABYX5|nr:MAG: NAD-dependent protein deacylase [Candidatus Abyssubacteria bacterium SURF_5]
MAATLKDIIEKAAAVIVERGHVVAFSGAGISSESGIPTFRDRGGLWDRFEAGSSGGIVGVIASYPEQAADILEELLITLRNAVPNPGHFALAELEQLGLLDAVITQNIDNLHRDAGNTRVHELHGNIYRLRCLACGKKGFRKREEFLAEFDRLIHVMRSKRISDIFSLMPSCECGGMLRPDFVSFGEPVQELHDSVNAAERCRVMLVLGTSGVVYPAAAIPGRARDAGAQIIEINPQKSALTRTAHYYLQGQSGIVLPKLVEEVIKKLP